MMLYEILFNIAVVLFVLAGVGIVVAIAVFFLCDVPDVSANLTGKKRAAAVADIAARRSGHVCHEGAACMEPASDGFDLETMRQMAHIESASSNPASISRESIASRTVPAFATSPEPKNEAELDDAKEKLSEWVSIGEQSVEEVFQPRRSYQISFADNNTTIVLPSIDAATCSESFAIVRKIVLGDSKTIITVG